MASYKHDIIQINNRLVRLHDILNNHYNAETSFETDTFQFIREWFSSASYFQFQTSGSTGKPKQITFSREQIIQSARATIKALKLSSSETSLLCLPSKYIAGKMMLVRSFVNQMKIIICEPSANPLEKINRDVKIDFVALVPLQIETMFEHGMEDRLNSIRNIIIGGAPLSTIIRHQIMDKLKSDVFATYGMTETISHVALENLRNGDGIYVPLPGVKIKLDVRGCLIVKTPVSPESFLTNDMAEIISEKGFRWLGRWDNLINTGGIKVVPELMEEKIKEIFVRLNLQRRFFVAGIQDKKLGQHVSIIVEGNPLPDPVQKMLKLEIINNFLKLEIPREFLFVEQFFDTETGKINRTETLNLVVNKT
jgi:O-succinylbenzoic acid--CoA ligase